MRPILVVAATDRELVREGDWRSLCCGVGPVDAAAATAAALARERPAAVVHLGIAGARRAAGLAPLALVIGTEAIYCDLSVPERWAPHRIIPDERLLAAARRSLTAAVPRPIGTTGRVGQSSGCDVEAMEGFAVLRAAALASVPALEVRVVSNEIEEADRGRWQFEEAFATVRSVTPQLVRAAAACFA
ncbi:MAG: hypothetical protein AB7N65_30155 [Vicinamibacterales bacterium]